MFPLVSYHVQTIFRDHLFAGVKSATQVTNLAATLMNPMQKLDYDENDLPVPSVTVHVV